MSATEKGVRILKRILMVLTVALVMVATTAVPAFAAPTFQDCPGVLTRNDLFLLGLTPPEAAKAFGYDNAGAAQKAIVDYCSQYR
jgi:hypothetical protein